jgi:transcriptional regulator with XRE-family HTH domain
MDRWRFGRLVKLLRQRHGWRQEDLASRAGVSRSVISRIELGQIGRIAWDDLVRVADAVGARLELEARWQGEGVDRLLDAAHAETVEEAAGLLRSTGWDVDVEVSFSIWGERGSIDIVGRHRATGLVAVIEVKASIADVNQTVMTLDRKTRLMPEIARERHWACTGVARFLVIREHSTARLRVSRHAGTFESAFPVRGRACIAWLGNPTTAPPSGLFFVRVQNSRTTVVLRRRVRAPTSASAVPRSARGSERP